MSKKGKQMQILKEKIVRYETDGSIVKGYDAGELIRCKDCVHYKKARTEEEYDACGILYEMFDSPLAVNEEDFCSQAERKEE